MNGIRIMMPYDTYRLYQIERGKSPAEIRHADEQAARFAFVRFPLFRRIMRPGAAARRPLPATGHGPPRPA